MAKAIASGDPRLMQKAGLESDISRLERLRAAHQDDQFAIRRQIRNAERDIEYSSRRIGEISKDIERLIPTAGEAFRMEVAKETFTERKLAGRALMKEILTLVQLQHAGEIVIASIGEFELEYSGERFGQDGYRYATMLLRTGAETEIELPVTTTPLGAVARVEHALAMFEESRRAIVIASPRPSGDWHPTVRGKGGILLLPVICPRGAGSWPRSRSRLPRMLWRGPSVLRPSRHGTARGGRKGGNEEGMSPLADRAFRRRWRSIAPVAIPARHPAQG